MDDNSTMRGIMKRSVSVKTPAPETKNQNLFRSTTLDIITRLLENAAFVCVHVVGNFQKISRKYVG